MAKKVEQIPSIASLSSIEDPNVKRFLGALKAQIEAMQQPVNKVGAENKRPTVQEMIDAGVSGAEFIK